MFMNRKSLSIKFAFLIEIGSNASDFSKLIFYIKYVYLIRGHFIIRKNYDIANYAMSPDVSQKYI